jgi:hypothetical protein
MRRTAALAALLLATLVLAAPAHAAAPRYIMVTGPGLLRPVLLADWNENLEFGVAVAGAPRTRDKLAKRPRFRIAEFWGWIGPPPTRPGQAGQHGWFYPAHGLRGPVIVLMADGILVPRVAPARVLRILARHGVPTRL